MYQVVFHLLHPGMFKRFSISKAKDPVNGLETSNPFERTLQLAMTFGGDSDTICSMSGALAGAFYGELGIPGLGRVFQAPILMTVAMKHYFYLFPK